MLAMNPSALLALAAIGLAIAVLASGPSDGSGAGAAPASRSGYIDPSASVILLGDSIGVGIAPKLKPLVPGTFDARVKTGRTALGAYGALVGNENLFDVVLLSLGSNDVLAMNIAALASLVAAVRSPTNQVLWIVPPGFTYGTSKGSAENIAAFTQAMSDLGVAVIASSPVPPAPDDPMHLHLAPSGYDAFAHVIAQGLYG